MKMWIPLLSLATLAPLALYGQEQDRDTTAVNNEDPFDLGEVVVTATRTPKKLKDIPVLTQVITARQVTERGIANIQDLLTQEVPGLNFQEVGFGTSIDIQGLSSKHVLFLIDGERIAGENGGNIDYSRIDLANIERIEIVKGASSALYGSQAMGGVINIITKQPKKKVEVKAGLRYAQMNEYNYPDLEKDDYMYMFRRNVDRQNLNANVNLGLNFGKVISSTNASYKSFDGYQLYDKAALEKYYPLYDTTVVMDINTMPSSISGYEDVNVSEKLTYNVSKRLTLTARGSFYMLNKYDFNPNNLYEKTLDYTYGASGEYRFNPKSVLSAHFHADQYYRYDKFEKIEGKRLEYRNSIYQPRILYTNTMVKNNEFTGGLEYYHESLLTDKFVPGQYTSKSQGYATLFVQDDWKIFKGFSVVLGVRGDYHNKYGFNVTPKASVMYKIGGFIIRANYARGYRSPSVKELYMDWDHLGMFHIFGNENLRPESNNYVSLSGEFSNRWMNVSANVYGNWFRDKIEGMWTNNQTELHYTNIGKNFLAGAEVTARFRIGRYVNVNGAYNYLYVGKDAEGVRLSSSSPHSGTIRAEFNSHVPEYATVVNFNGTITGKKKFDVLDNLNVDGKDIETYYKAEIDAYTLWNLSVTQYIKNFLYITVGVNNLFNYTADIISFNSSVNPGRRFFVSCNYVF